MEFLTKKVVNGCRLGELKFTKDEKRKKNLETPACILYTRGGAAPHLTNNLVDEFIHDYIGVQITLPTVFQHPGPDVLKEYAKGFADFLDLKGHHFIYCSVLDPAQEIQCSYNEGKNISLWNSSGRKKINVEHFIEITTAFKPDIVECLCDTVPEGQTAKRNKKSVERTLKYLDEVLESQRNNETLKEVNILGAIVGGDSKTERTNCAVETSKRPVSGFVIEGINLSIDNARSLLETTVSQLPRDKPCFFCGAVSPEDIFSAIECGVDVFDSSFAYEATQNGCALNFMFGNKRYKPEMKYTIKQTKPSDNSDHHQPITNTGKKDVSETQYEIILSSSRYKDDFSPLVVSCCCYSCTNHTRSYLYHLLQTKEMLAQVLLMIHNFHQYFQFFKHLRDAIKNDNYNNFKNSFLKL